MWGRGVAAAAAAAARNKGLGGQQVCRANKSEERNTGLASMTIVNTCMKVWKN